MLEYVVRGFIWWRGSDGSCPSPWQDNVLQCKLDAKGVAAELERAGATLLTQGNTHQAELEQKCHFVRVARDGIALHLATQKEFLLVRRPPLERALSAASLCPGWVHAF